MEIKNIRLELTEGVSKKSNKKYNKLDVVLPNGIVLCSYFLNDKDLYLLKSAR